MAKLFVFVVALIAVSISLLLAEPSRSDNPSWSVASAPRWASRVWLQPRPRMYRPGFSYGRAWPGH